LYKHYKKYSKKMEILIVGKGSMGLRHAKIFKKLGNNVSFFRKNKSNIKTKLVFNEFFDFNLIKKKFYNLIVICNPSALHVKYLIKFKNLSDNFLLEKPLCTNFHDLKILKNLSKIKNIYTGYMMRHDERINKIKKICMKKKELIYAEFKWNTFMPYWHKYENYKNSYASKKKLGGGVILTCSHEVDMAIFLFGEAKSVFCLKSKNKLNIEVEDNVLIIIEHKRNIISFVNLDFGNKFFKREFSVNFINKKIYYNFEKKNIYEVNMKKKKFFKVKPKQSIEKIYYNQNKKIQQNVLNNKSIYLNLETEKVLLAALDSIKQKKKIIIN